MYCFIHNNSGCLPGLGILYNVCEGIVLITLTYNDSEFTSLGYSLQCVRGVLFRMTVDVDWA